MRYALLRLSFVVALGSLVSMPPRVLAISKSTGQPPSVTRTSLSETPATPSGGDSHAPLVTVKVRALAPDKVKVSDPVQGTVRATVMAIDRAMSQVTVQTHEGQRLILYLTPASLEGMRVSHQCILQVAQRSEPESSLDEALYGSHRW